MLAPQTRFSLSDLINWLLGSGGQPVLARYRFFRALLWIAGLACVLLAAPGLRALTLGEEGASGIGADVPAHAGLLVIVGQRAPDREPALAAAGIIGFCRHCCAASGAPFDAAMTRAIC